MDSRTASTLSIGVLGGIATYVTATVVTVPVWVVFLTWASFFFFGGRLSGATRSLASNLVGVVIASGTLLVIERVEAGTVLTAVAVGVGSAVMVQASRVQVLALTPGVVIGFASTVGIAAVSGESLSTTTISNPLLVAAMACVLGACFGFASEFIADKITAKSPVAA